MATMRNIFDSIAASCEILYVRTLNGSICYGDYKHGYQLVWHILFVCLRLRYQ